MATMHYISPTSDENYSIALILQEEDWYPASTIRRLIHDLDNVNFSTQEGRNAGLSLITSLTSVPPYVMLNDLDRDDTRFGNIAPGAVPSGSNPYSSWVAAFCDGWDNIFAALMNSLNFKDRTNSTEPDTTSTPLNSMVVYRQFNDASQAFRWAVIDAKAQFRNRTGIYKRADFETKYGLFFVEGFQLPTGDE